MNIHVSSQRSDYHDTSYEDISHTRGWVTIYSYILTYYQVIDDNDDNDDDENDDENKNDAEDDEDNHIMW